MYQFGWVFYSKFLLKQLQFPGLDIHSDSGELAQTASCNMRNR